jgi:hypothetical protein
MRARIVLAACALALVTASFALADAWNRKIQFTFSEPVAIPAVHQPGWGVLPPGTYVFKIVDSNADRHIVQISNKDETVVYATILAVPNLRLKATDKIVLTFRERPAGQPYALRAMFYPGKEWGEEFVYPKFVATEIAKATSETVLSMPIKEENAMPAAPEVVAELEATPLTAVEPSGAEVQTADAVTPPTPAQLNAAATEELPKTASPLPFIGLMGLLALGAGFTLRFAETRAR